MNRVILIATIGVLFWVFIHYAYAQYKQPSIQLGVVECEHQEDSMIVINRKHISSHVDSLLMDVTERVADSDVKAGTISLEFGSSPMKNGAINTAFGFKAKRHEANFSNSDLKFTTAPRHTLIGQVRWDKDSGGM